MSPNLHSSSNTISRYWQRFRAISKGRFHAPWLLMAIAMIAMMSADVLAERTVFRTNTRLFLGLFTPAWNIAGALLITYFTLRKYSQLHQKAVDEVNERKDVEKSLRSLQADLERKVRERTAVLSQLNQKLETEIALRERAEHTRAMLIQQILSVQEVERHRISRELHDQLGQHLAVLNFRLEALKNSMDEKSHNLIQPFQALIKQIGHDVHDLAVRLRPPSLDDMGLHATLVNYIEEWSEQSCVKVDFHTVGLETNRLPASLETTVFRIVQEALTNVLKHARASQVSLVIRRGGREVVAVVEDDGSGFDPELVLNIPSTNQRLGLLGIRERTALVGGRFSIDSVCGAGTTLLVRLPIPDEETTHSHA